MLGPQSRTSTARGSHQRGRTPSLPLITLSTLKNKAQAEYYLSAPLEKYTRQRPPKPRGQTREPPPAPGTCAASGPRGAGRPREGGDEPGQTPYPPPSPSGTLPGKSRGRSAAGRTPPRPHSPARGRRGRPGPAQRSRSPRPPPPQRGPRSIRHAPTGAVRRRPPLAERRIAVRLQLGFKGSSPAWSLPVTPHPPQGVPSGSNDTYPSNVTEIMSGRPLPAKAVLKFSGSSTKL